MNGIGANIDMDLGINSTHLQILPTPVKGKSDRCTYQQLLLANGLQALIVHDPLTDTGSASLDVNVGFLSDPIEYPGLAHFLEHLLFMGTEKYQDESEYQSFLSEHGGNSNAYTDNEHTNYFFDVSVDHLEQALDRFAQFFISPLFNVSCLDRERDAVHSEHLKNLNDDQWRKEQLLRHLSNKHHPFHRFGTGNAQTLSGEEIRQEIISFYYKHYTPNLMRLVVYGRQNLEQLSGWVVEMFSQVPSHTHTTSTMCFSFGDLCTSSTERDSSSIIASPCCVQDPMKSADSDALDVNVESSSTASISPNTKSPICTESEHAIKKVSPHPCTLPLLTKMRPLKRLRELNFYWMVPLVEMDPNIKSLELIASLVAQESPGSLLAILKNCNWATGLQADASEHLSDFDIFHVMISLSSNGLEHFEKVIGLTFSYFSFIKENHSSMLNFWSETSQIEIISFNFGDAKDPSAMAHETAREMHRYPPENVIRGPFLLQVNDKGLKSHLIDELIPTRCHVILVAGDHSDSTSSDTEYRDDGGEDDSDDDYMDEDSSDDNFIDENTGPCGAFIQSPDENRRVDSLKSISDLSHASELGTKSVHLDNSNFSSMVDEKRPSSQDQQIEPWYGTLFRSRTLSQKEIGEMIQGLDQLALFTAPKPNLFIVDDFTLVRQRKDSKSSSGKKEASTCSIGKKEDPHVFSERKHPIHNSSGNVESAAALTSSSIFPWPRYFIASGDKSDKSIKLQSEVSLPQLIIPGLAFKQDDLFFLPKGILFFFIQRPVLVRCDPKKYAKDLLLHALLIDAIDEEFYDASVAGLNYFFEIKSTGIFLRLSGFSQKLPLLGCQLLKKIVSREPFYNYRRFEVVCERLVKDLENSALEPPFKQTRSLLSLLLNELLPGSDELVAVLNEIKASSIPSTITKPFEAQNQVIEKPNTDLTTIDAQKMEILPFFIPGSEVKFHSLIHGNFEESVAVSLFRSITTTLKDADLTILSDEVSEDELVKDLSQSRLLKDKKDAMQEKRKKNPLHSSIARLPVGRPVVIGRKSMDDPNNCIHVYFQLGEIDGMSDCEVHSKQLSGQTSDQSTIAKSASQKNNCHQESNGVKGGSLHNISKYALSLLLAQVLMEPFFDQLRTKEQLGYIVRCQARCDGNTFGLEFVIQSNRCPFFLWGRIWNFLTDFHVKLTSKSYSTDDFNRNRDAIIHHLTERPSKLLVESLPYWAAMWRGDYAWNLSEQVASFLFSDKVDKHVLGRFFQENLLNELDIRLAVIAIYGTSSCAPVCKLLSPVISDGTISICQSTRTASSDDKPGLSFHDGGLSSQIPSFKSDEITQALIDGNSREKCPGINAFKGIFNDAILLSLNPGLDTHAIQQWKLSLSSKR